MTKKHFKFTTVILIGLAGYFLALSIVLVASANGSNSNGLGFSISKRSPTQKALPRKQLVKSWSGSGSAQHTALGHALDKSRAGPNRCLNSPTCNNSTVDQASAGSPVGDHYSSSDIGVIGGQDIAGNGGRLADASSFVPSPTFGGFGIGGDDRAQLNTSGPTTANVSEGATPPDPTESSLDLPSVEPQLSSVPQDLPNNPSGSDNPVTENLSPGASPQSGLPGSVTVPEPPTLWLFLASLATLVTMPRFARRRFALRTSRMRLFASGSSRDNYAAGKSMNQASKTSEPSSISVIANPYGLNRLR